MASFAEELEFENPSMDLLYRLTHIVDTDNDIFKRPFGGYDSLWEWILRHRRGHLVASHFLENRGSLVPINAVNTVTGDSVITNSANRVIHPDVFKTLLCYGEHLDFINQKTGDSFLHALAKKVSIFEQRKALILLRNVIDEIENPKLEFFVYEQVNFPDPDHKNIDGNTALNICLQNGKIELACILVIRLGANWAVGQNEDYSAEENVLDFWNRVYGISSNNFLSEVGDACTVCCETLNVPEEIYSMECCGTLIHVECFRIYLARSPKPQCMFCNMLVVEEVRRKVPLSIYRFQWRPYINDEAIEAAAAAMARTEQKKFEKYLANVIKEEEEGRSVTTRAGRDDGPTARAGGSRRRQDDTTTRASRRRRQDDAM